MYEQFSEFLGKDGTQFWFGIVESNDCPLTLYRVKVRIYGIHPESRDDVPTKDLPWAITMQPSNSSSSSGVGTFAAIANGSMVFGIFLDGKLAQYPMVLGTIPTIHRPNAPGSPGNTDGGYLNNSSLNSYGGTKPYHGGGSGLANEGGNSLRDDGARLTKGDAGNWPLKIYTSGPAPAGLACKDGQGSLNFHRPTALALEELTRQWGKGKLSINSAYRTVEYNARQRGAATNSWHTKGRALDISFKRGPLTRSDLPAFGALAVKNGFIGFGIYDKEQFIHIDTGSARIYQGNFPEFQAALAKAGWRPGMKPLMGVKAEAPPTTSKTSDKDTSPAEQKNTTATSDKDTSPYSNQNKKYENTKEGVQEQIRDSFREKGYTEAQTAGALSHIQRESEFNPNAVGDNGKAFGLAQWNDRQPAMREWTQANGYSPNSVEGQVAFIHHELQGKESKAGNALRNASTPEEASIAMNRYERFKGWNDPSHPEYNARIQLANAKFSGEKGPSGKLPGFHDPTNSMPYANYRGKPGTHGSAKGLNGNPYITNASHNQSGKLNGFPAAGNKGTFGEPANPSAPQFPHNDVKATKSGHMFEMDDTPGAERVAITHRSGSATVFTAKGTTINRTVGNSYNMTARDSFNGTAGDHHITAVGDMNLRSTSDLTIQSDGSISTIYGNDGTMTISGKLDISVGEGLQIRANKIIIQATQIDMYSTGSINLHAEEDINIKGKKINMEGSAEINQKTAIMKSTASGNMMIKGSTVYVDDIIRMAEGGAQDAPSAPDAKSTDLGKPGNRKKIKKNAPPAENPDTYVTTEEAMKVYST